MLKTLSLDAPLDPIAAVRGLRRHGPVVALESALVRPGLGQRSYVAGLPLCVAEFRNGRWNVQVMRGTAGDLQPDPSSRSQPFAGLRDIVDRVAAARGVPVRAFGFFGYECVGERAAEPRELPDAWFLITEFVLEWAPSVRPVLHCMDAGLGRSVLAECREQDPAGGSPLESRSLVQDGCEADIEAALSRERGPDLDLESYREVFTKIREELRQGNSYQLCFTYPIRRSFDGDSLNLYRQLRHGNPAPFAGYLEAGDMALVSSSPERFVRVEADGRVEARPMKGTARKCGDPVTDATVRAALESSIKDRAENLMIADLLRNDLGRVCELGSVRVPARARLEEYATVFQLVSVIEGRLRAGQGVAELLQAAFPPGSMTGAPKPRSIEILQRLESGPRGPYSGILGHWGSDGTADFSVLIRTWVLHGSTATAGVGGGVVWDSSAEAEFQESRVKAAAMLRALARVSGPRAHEHTAS